MRKIIITTTSFSQYKEVKNLFKRKDFKVVLNYLGRKLKKEEILEICKGAIGIIAGTESLDKDILNKLSPSLKVISRCGAGLDNIDIKAAQNLGIKIYNTPDALTLAVAELTIGLMINLLRKVRLMDGEVRAGEWKKEMGNLLSRKYIGIIGFGRIGRKTTELLHPFECEIKYTDPLLGDGISGFEKVPLENLLSWADIVSIHASCVNEIIGKKEIGLMKKGSYLLNLSRGKAVNQQALYQALKSNYLAGAALDVFDQEPYKGPLRELNNVILTPHVGSYAIEARSKMELEAAKNLIKGLEEEK